VLRVAAGGTADRYTLDTHTDGETNIGGGGVVLCLSFAADNDASKIKLRVFGCLIAVTDTCQAGYLLRLPQKVFFCGFGLYLISRKSFRFLCLRRNSIHSCILLRKVKGETDRNEKFENQFRPMSFSAVLQRCFMRVSAVTFAFYWSTL
jgi:hypothetical protein